MSSSLGYIQIKHSGEKEKRENVLFEQIPRFRVWPVNNFKTDSKSGFFQTRLEAIQKHLSSWAINLNTSFVFLLFLEHLEIIERLTFPNQNVKSLWDGNPKKSLSLAIRNTFTLSNTSEVICKRLWNWSMQLFLRTLLLWLLSNPAKTSKSKE